MSSDKGWAGFDTEDYSGVTVLHIDSADTLVVFHLPPDITHEEASHLADMLAERLPPSLHARLLLDGRITMTIASASDVTKATP